MTGSIQVVAQVQALPFVRLCTGSSSDQTALAAFVLLVLLTAAQAGVVGYSVWARIAQARSWWRILQVRKAVHLSSVAAWVCVIVQQLSCKTLALQSI